MEWSFWSGCSVTCGSGQMTRQRLCGNPQPANGGSGCSGAGIEHNSCQTMVCPGKVSCKIKISNKSNILIK